MLRYDSLAMAGPMLQHIFDTINTHYLILNVSNNSPGIYQMASSANFTCNELLSTIECTATVFMPI